MKRYILATAIASIVAAPAMALAAGNNILSVHILDQQTGKQANRRPAWRSYWSRKRITDGRN